MADRRSHFHPSALLAGALGNGLWGLISPGVGAVTGGIAAAATSLPWYLLVVIGVGSALIALPFISVALKRIRRPATAVADDDAYRALRATDRARVTMRDRSKSRGADLADDSSLTMENDSEIT